MTAACSESWQDRTRLLIGEDGIANLGSASVFIAGVGGVGGYVAEMLARSGVGHLALVDSDTVSLTNLNRQLIATLPDVGKPKTELFRKRFLSINPAIDVKCIDAYITPENVADMIDEGQDDRPYDYVVDAIDTVAPKVALIAHCMRRNIPVISSMGAGGRLDPTKVGYCDLWETREDGLARAVRQRLKKMGLRRRLDVVASSEAPRHSAVIDLDMPNKRSSYGTLATIPAIFGLMMANKVIMKLAQPQR